MKTKAPSPHQWHLLRQLQLAGCPLDTSHSAPPDYPVSLVDMCSQARTNIYGLQGGVGIALFVRIVATVPIMIAGYRLEASWLTAPCHWVPPCIKHNPTSCLQITNGEHRMFTKALNNRVLWRGRLKKGEFLQGFLVGTTNAPLCQTDGELSATLWIRDVKGAEYPYALTLHHRAVIQEREGAP